MSEHAGVVREANSCMSEVEYCRVDDGDQPRQFNNSTPGLANEAFADLLLCCYALLSSSFNLC